MKEAQRDEFERCHHIATNGSLNLDVRSALFVFFSFLLSPAQQKIAEERDGNGERGA